MKRRLALCLAVCVLIGLAAVAEKPATIHTIFTGISDVYLPDGTHFLSIPWPVLHGELRITGEVLHYMDFSGDGNLINDGQGRMRGQAFYVDPLYGMFTNRARYSGTSELILFDEWTGTESGTWTKIYDVFGTADEILPYYPWAEPIGSAEGKGWWHIFTEVQTYIPIYPP